MIGFWIGGCGIWGCGSCGICCCGGCGGAISRGMCSWRTCLGTECWNDPVEAGCTATVFWTLNCSEWTGTTWRTRGDCKVRLFIFLSLSKKITPCKEWIEHSLLTRESEGFGVGWAFEGALSGGWKVTITSQILPHKATHVLLGVMLSLRKLGRCDLRTNEVGDLSERGGGVTWGAQSWLDYREQTGSVKLRGSTGFLERL